MVVTEASAGVARAKRWSLSWLLSKHRAALAAGALAVAAAFALVARRSR